MKNFNIQTGIAQLLKQEPPRAKSLVMTIFGDAILPHGGAIWLGSLIDLLTAFGMNDRLVRTSVFRLAEEGWLEGSRNGRRSSYAIKSAALPRLERAYRRIYASPDVHWHGNWTLVFAISSALDASERSVLRKELLWQGYCIISPGVFAHPAGDHEILQEILERAGVQDRIFVSSASDSKLTGTRPLSELIEMGWDLHAVISDYQGFIHRFSPFLEALQQDNTLDGATAFALRTLLIHAYRRVQLHDPQLPIELLPANWPGSSAYTLCRQLYRLSHAAAEDFLMSSLKKEDETIPTAAAYFYERFEGLQSQEAEPAIVARSA